MTRTGTPIVTPRQAARRAEDEAFGKRQSDWPVPGLYAYRLRKGAVEVAVEIVCAPTPDPDVIDNIQDRSPMWSARVNGSDDPQAGPTPSDLCCSVYIFGRRIERAEFEFLLADRQWAADHRPDLPEASPTKPVDLRTLDPKLLL